MHCLDRKSLYPNRLLVGKHFDLKKTVGFCCYSEGNSYLAGLAVVAHVGGGSWCYR